MVLKNCYSIPDNRGDWILDFNDWILCFIGLHCFVLMRLLFAPLMFIKRMTFNQVHIFKISP